MRLNRFIGNFDLTRQEVKIENAENIKQIKDVLRLKVGGRIILCDGRGSEAEVVIIRMEKNKIVTEIEKVPARNATNSVAGGEKSPEMKRKVSLYLAILKKENFELAIQKAVECGVSKVIPVVTERTVKTGLNFERLEKIMLEASEQSGRNIVPQLFPILPFKDALLEGSSASEKIIFDLETEAYSPNEKASEVSIFIGPEGGFTEKEVELAKSSGYAVASLGETTLRGETAAIVATYRAVNGV